MASISKANTLSAADEHTLVQVFDPESAPTAPSIVIDPTLPSDPNITSTVLLKQLKAREVEAVRLVEKYSETPTLSFTGPPTGSISGDNNERKHATYLEALKVLDALINEHPGYASAYNNRAQLRRWRYGDALQDQSQLQSRSELAEAYRDVMFDLERAIELVTPPNGTSRTSPAQAKLLGQAWMQKGALYWGMSRQSGASTKPMTVASSATANAAVDLEILHLDKSQLEEEGSRCFYMAGMYGNEAGKNLAVHTNPYARLCGNIVKEAMKREGVSA
jgi:hypothetical protein